jgi:hypothetical protein
LALVDYQSGWVTGQPEDAMALRYPLGFQASGWTGLYRELVIAATHLNIGYYGWRAGTFTEVRYMNGRSAHLSPALNAGSIAVQSVFTRLYDQPFWNDAIYGEQGFTSRYVQMFGDPWVKPVSWSRRFRPGWRSRKLFCPSHQASAGA